MCYIIDSQKYCAFDVRIKNQRKVSMKLKKGQKRPKVFLLWRSKINPSGEPSMLGVFSEVVVARRYMRRITKDDWADKTASVNGGCRETYRNSTDWFHIEKNTVDGRL